MEAKVEAKANKETGAEKETEEYIRKEFEFSNKALQIANKKAVEKKEAKEFLEMASAYLNDSLHFLKQKDYIRAIAAIYYAHAWLDAGARLGFWKLTKKEKRYFSID
jgi:hypothetical protein